MESFTITEMSYASVTILGAIGGILMVIWKSRCSTINCCYGMIRCDREVLKDLEVRRRDIPSPVSMDDLNV